MSIKVIVASDLHYISSKINDCGELFQKKMESSDGKVCVHIENLVDAFLSEVKALKPDFLILSGDLSFNGELQSHADLAEKLESVARQGISILVTTANHDVYTRNAGSFFEDTFSPLPSSNAQDFRTVYNDFGYSKALSMDDDSLSYVYQADDAIRFLCIDSNTQQEHCMVSDKTLCWMERQLEESAKHKQKVVVVGHQNLFRHTLFLKGFVIDKSEALQALFWKYGVSLFLSGHLHVQHWLTEKGTTDIALSSLSVSPCQYGILQISDDKKISYCTKEVDFDFKRFASICVERTIARQCAAQLLKSDFSREQIEKMTGFACKADLMYFSGDMKGFNLLDPSMEIQNLWSKSHTPTGSYLSYMKRDSGKDFRVWNGTL